MKKENLKPLRPLKGEAMAPSGQQVAKPTRRSFSNEYKLRILEELASCQGKRGAVGQILRREGLYASQVAQWRAALEEGLSEPFKEKMRGRKPDPTLPLRQKIAKMEKENRRLKKKLHQAEVLLELQKKVAALFQEEDPEDP